MKKTTLSLYNENKENYRELEKFLLTIYGVERALIDVNDGDLKVEYNENLINEATVIDSLKNKGITINQPWKIIKTHEEEEAVVDTVSFYYAAIDDRYLQQHLPLVYLFLP